MKPVSRRFNPIWPRATKSETSRIWSVGRRARPGTRGVEKILHATCKMCSPWPRLHLLPEFHIHPSLYSAVSVLPPAMDRFLFVSCVLCSVISTEGWVHSWCWRCLPSINGKVLVLEVSILIKEVTLLHTLIKPNNFELLGCTGKASVLKYPWSHCSALDLWASGPSIAATCQATLVRETPIDRNISQPNE